MSSPKGRALKEKQFWCCVALWLHYSVHGLSTWRTRDEMLSPPTPFPALLILLLSRISLFSIKSVDHTNICSKYPISLEEVFLNIRYIYSEYKIPNKPVSCSPQPHALQGWGHTHILMTGFPKAVSLAPAGKAKRQWAGTRPSQRGAEGWGLTHTDTSPGCAPLNATLEQPPNLQ